MSRVVDCDALIREGRIAKAEEFARAAAMLPDSAGLPDGFVAMCILAGIAASDVICCARLGRHARGGAHQVAVALLKLAAPGVEAHPARLLQMKTRSEYGSQGVSADDVKRAGRAMESLLEEARRARPGTT